VRETVEKSSTSKKSDEPLQIRITATPAKYLASLDKPTKSRITAKLQEIAKAPYDIRLSKPLVNRAQRGARVGGYRILFEIVEQELVVADIGPRGQVYR